jgi:5-hydroxyisourate hydrolase
MGKLTTHILDTAHGRPAAGVAIELHGIAVGARLLLVRAQTNVDGRCDAPLLADYKFQPGIYELDFHIGNYFAGLGVAVPQPRFLDVITIRIGVSDASAHYHVPLLVSPYGYSTYRGS